MQHDAEKERAKQEMLQSLRSPLLLSGERFLANVALHLILTVLVIRLQTKRAKSR